MTRLAPRRVSREAPPANQPLRRQPRANNAAAAARRAAPGRAPAPRLSARAGGSARVGRRDAPRSPLLPPPTPPRTAGQRQPEARRQRHHAARAPLLVVLLLLRCCCGGRGVAQSSLVLEDQLPQLVHRRHPLHSRPAGAVAAGGGEAALGKEGGEVNLGGRAVAGPQAPHARKQVLSRLGARQEAGAVDGLHWGGQWGGGHAGGDSPLLRFLRFRSQIL